jgi:hypothetical protein
MALKFAPVVFLSDSPYAMQLLHVIVDPYYPLRC